jgi:mono/diheme cytochrome c family protein
MLQTVKIAVVALLVAVLLTSCGSDPRSAGLEYAPQMYHSIPLEPYSQIDYNEYFVKGPDAGLNAQRPVRGTVARGKMGYIYPYKNDSLGYELAKNLKNPLTATPELLANGKKLYSYYCVHCHGEKGDGQGIIPSAEVYPYPPSYYGDQLLTKPVGQYFHSITWGKGVMGSHASQISPNEIWQVILYVQELQRQGTGQAAAPAPANSTETIAAN